MATVREMARLLAGLPERWQDVEMLGMNEDYPVTGVDLFAYKRGKPARVRITDSFSPTVNTDGIVHPREESKLWP
jgi:hypothetical protein